MKKISKVRFAQLVNKNDNYLLADMRSPVSFRDGHIENAVNLPLRNFINKIMGMSRDTLIIAYSTSLSDIDLTQGVNYAEQLGFTKIFVAEFQDLK